MPAKNSRALNVLNAGAYSAARPSFAASRPHPLSQRDGVRNFGTIRAVRESANGTGIDAPE